MEPKTALFFAFLVIVALGCALWYFSGGKREPIEPVEQPDQPETTPTVHTQDSGGGTTPSKPL